MSQASDAHPPALSSTMTAPKPEHLLSLPDVPTFAILSFLPLQQLIVNVPLVHHRLAPIRESILKTNQHLTIYIGDQKETKRRQLNSSLRLPFASHLVDSTGALLYPQTDISTLHLATLDRHSMEKLTSLMPGIVHLQVVISHVRISVLPQLTILLTNWAPTLRTLKVTIGTLYSKGGTLYTQEGILRNATSPTNVSNLHSLIKEINDKLKALQHLTLDIGCALNLNSEEFLRGGKTGVPLSLPILGQLREFYLDLDNRPSATNFLLTQLEAYATEKLTTIRLGGHFRWNWNQVANSPFVERFTMVPLNEYRISNETPFLRPFSNLTVYGFNWANSNAEIVALLRVLSKLPHFQCLKVGSFSPVSHPIPGPSTDLPSLGSVTVLELRIDIRDTTKHHDCLQMPYWERLFPSLQILKVTYYGTFCALCYPDDDWTARDRLDYAQVTPCLKQVFAPLRDLPSLRKIFYQREGQIDFIAEFTPQGEFVRTHEYIC